MNSFFTNKCPSVLIGIGFWISIATFSFGQTDGKTDHAKHEEHAKQTKHKSMEDQVSSLNAEVAKLKAAIAADHKMPRADKDNASHQMGEKSAGMSKDGKKSGSMGGMSKGMEMGMMKGKGMSSKKMSGGMKKMGGGMMNGMGMKMMGKMPDASMENSSLPGFAGASHIYHIGSTGFFLDHADHLQLSTEQQKQLNQIKEAAVLEQSEFDRQIESAEHQLWSLTSKGQPDGSAIETKLADIGVLNSQKRFNFITAAGKAAQVLTKEQRDVLTGDMPAKAPEIPAEKKEADKHDHNEGN